MKRSSFVSLEEKEHIYETQNGDILRSTTTIIKSKFTEFDADSVICGMMKRSNWNRSKYYGMTANEIKLQWKTHNEEASLLGTKMHAIIEEYLLKLNPKDFQCNGINEKYVPYNPEEECVIQHIVSKGTDLERFTEWWSGFILHLNSSTFARDGYVIAPEYLLYSMEYNIAGTIDLVIINPHGETILLDWKRSKEIVLENGYRKGKGVFSCYDDCNYYHYSIQLNTYRKLLELITVEVNGVITQPKVVQMCLVVLPPEVPDTVDVYPVKFMNEWTLEDLCGI